MKRRNRKRISKAANPPKSANNAEQAQSPSESSSAAEKLGNSPNIPSDAENPAGPSVSLAGADRRTHPRYEFFAAAEIAASESGPPTETRVRDFSQQGCYVDTNNPLPLGTATHIRTTMGAPRLETPATARYSTRTQ